ncbi:hypothetical protein CR513_24429, partial [Mucuna pruriens]
MVKVESGIILDSPLVPRPNYLLQRVCKPSKTPFVSYATEACFTLEKRDANLREHHGGSERRKKKSLDKTIDVQIPLDRKSWFHHLRQVMVGNSAPTIGVKNSTSNGCFAYSSFSMYHNPLHPIFRSGIQKSINFLHSTMKSNRASNMFRDLLNDVLNTLVFRFLGPAQSKGVLSLETRTGIEEPTIVKESNIEEGIRCNMVGSSHFVLRALPVFDGKLFDNWRVKMLAVFGFQDVIEVVTVGFVEPRRNATEEQRLIFKQL